MSTYSNVAAGSLKSAADNALNELSRHNLASIKDSLNTNILSPKVNTLAKNKLQDIATSTSINGSIAVLQKKLQNVKSAADHIKNIQNYERKIRSLRNDRDEDGKITSSAQSSISYYQRLISSEESTINSLLS